MTRKSVQDFSRMSFIHLCNVIDIVMINTYWLLSIKIEKLKKLLRPF